jgi:hypothetical protein
MPIYYHTTHIKITKIAPTKQTHNYDIHITAIIQPTWTTSHHTKQQVLTTITSHNKECTLTCTVHYTELWMLHYTTQIVYYYTLNRIQYLPQTKQQGVLKTVPFSEYTLLHHYLVYRPTSTGHSTRRKRQTATSALTIKNIDLIGTANNPL